MDSVSIAFVWLLSGLKRDEVQVLIMRFCLVTSCIISFSVFMFLRDQKGLFLPTCQLGIAASFHHLLLNFLSWPPQLVRSGRGKSPCFPASLILKQHCKERHKKDSPDCKESHLFWEKKKKAVVCYIQLLSLVFLQKHTSQRTYRCRVARSYSVLKSQLFVPRIRDKPDKCTRKDLGRLMYCVWDLGSCSVCVLGILKCWCKKAWQESGWYSSWVQSIPYIFFFFLRKRLPTHYIPFKVFDIFIFWLLAWYENTPYSQYFLNSSSRALFFFFFPRHSNENK